MVSNNEIMRMIFKAFEEKRYMITWRSKDKDNLKWTLDIFIRDGNILGVKILGTTKYQRMMKIEKATIAYAEKFKVSILNMEIPEEHIQWLIYYIQNIINTHMWALV